MYSHLNDGKRTEMKRILLPVILLLFLVSFFKTPDVAYACSCIMPGLPLEEMERSEAVFSAEVVDIRGSEPFSGNSSGIEPKLVAMEVSEVWKGSVEAEVVVQTAADSAACGYDFQVGGEYLVYASTTDGALSVSLCSRTMPLSNAGEDLAALGEGVAPAPVEAAEETSPILAYGPYILVGVVGIGLIAVAVYAGRKR